MLTADPEDALVPLFIKQPYSNAYEQVGTGIFVDFENTPFLFTAAHVTDHLGHSELAVPAYGSIDAIDGYVGSIDTLPGMSRAQDHVDIAYYRLSTSFAKRMYAYFRPWPQSRCEIIKSALDLRVCTVYGYPSSRAKRVKGKYHSETASFRGVAASIETYEELGLSPETSIIIHFDRKRTVLPKDCRLMTPVSPRGVSGGGIFAWPSGHELSEDWTLPQLVGIFHTYKKAEGLLIGTQLVPVIAATLLGRMKGFEGVV